MKKALHVPPEDFRFPFPVSFVNMSGQLLDLHSFRDADGHCVVVIGKPGMTKEEAETHARKVFEGPIQ